MRRIGPRVAAASATFLVLLGLSAGKAVGDSIVETVYAEPVSYYVPTGYVATSRVVPSSVSYVPTAYQYSYSPTSYSYVPTSYSYAPTSYSYAPTSYRTTSYAASPSYVTTSYSSAPTYTTTYYRRGLLSRLFSRPVIETTASYSYDLTPTSYYLPTTISLAPTVATAYAMPCQEAPVAFSPPPPSYPSGNGNASSNGNGGAMGQTVTSKPKSAVVEPNYQDSGASSKEGVAAPADEIKNPPDSPVVDPNNLFDPPAVSPPQPGDTQTRSSFKPASPTVMTPKAGVSATNLLRGEVVGGLSNQGLEGREVIFSDLTGTYPPKKKTTDANGRFEVYLPNGGWTISVLDPTAQAGTKPVDYPDPITATGGRYVDESGSPIYSLRLSN